MNVDDAGIPTSEAPEKKEHFQFEVPEDCHIKGFGNLTGDESDGAVAARLRRWYRPRSESQR